MPLTDVQIKNLAPRSKPYKKFDGFGLYILVKPNGSKLWRKKYYFNEKERTHSIGVYPSVSLKQARAERAKIQELIAQGIDPSLEKKRSKRGVATFYDIAVDWWELNSGLTIEQLKECDYSHRLLSEKINKSRDVWNTKHAVKIWRRLEKYVFFELKSHSIDGIKATDIRRVLKKVAGKGLMDVPKRVLQYISGIFNHAVIDGTCDFNPCYGLEKSLPKFKTAHRKSLALNELEPFFKALNHSTSDPIIIIAIKLLILTCVRSKELRYAEWSEFDFDEKLWLIPSEKMKSKREHKVPLTPEMIHLLENLKQYSGNSVYLFPSKRSKDGVIGENTLNVAIDKIGYKGKVNPHGFRATAKTAWIEAGYSDLATELQLAHVDKNQVREAYNYRTQLLEERREMMEWYSIKVFELKSES